MLFRTAVLVASIAALAVPFAEAQPNPNGEMNRVIDTPPSQTDHRQVCIATKYCAVSLSGPG